MLTDQNFLEVTNMHLLLMVTKAGMQMTQVKMLMSGKQP